MPTYEYQCEACDLEFEEFQSITAEPLEKCPKCEGKVRRLISAGNGLIFKGSGFYITDYKNSKQSSDSGSDSKKPAKSETKTGAKKETKSTEKTSESK